jgi:hypothetical protein
LWSPVSPSLYTAELTARSAGTSSETITVNFGIRSAVYQDTMVFINGDSIRPVYPGDQWILEFNNSNSVQEKRMLEEANFNTFPEDACVSACLLPLLEKKGILLIRRKTALDPASHRPYLNSPSVIWTE